MTGLYPLHHQALENLVAPNSVRHAASLAWTLQKKGYSTLFASDDRRFNNLDREFGFQQIIGPKIGVNDILAGSLCDFPLSNLLINTRPGALLMPYNHMNRAGHFSYYPATFDKALEGALARETGQKPLFLAAHFALPHWPYAWAQSSPALVKDEYSLEERGSIYRSAVLEADRQVGNLLQVLQKRGFLQNSLVILLSDHGETLYEKGSRKIKPELYQGKGREQLLSYFKEETSTQPDKSAGHGSDLLSPSQFHCVLAFTIFHQGKPLTRPKRVETRVSLIDIAPTIYSFLHLKQAEPMDGISLINTLLSGEQPEQNRPFMLESGMFPNQFLTRDKALVYAQAIFRVNPENNRLEIRPEKLPVINAMKLYGMIQGDWLLALYPKGQYYITVILRLNDGQWTDNPESDFARKSPLANRLDQLRSFYRDVLADYPRVSLKAGLSMSAQATSSQRQ